MSTTADTHRSPMLHIARVPGELGPVIRCSGELTLATEEALRRELRFLASPRHPALILNVSGCRALDAAGLRLLVDTCGQLRDTGRRFAVVVGTDGVACLIRTLDPEHLLPVFPSEHTAVTALSSTPAAPATEA